VVLLQPHRTVIANFVPGNFSLFRRNPWQPLAEPWGSAESRLKNTGIEECCSPYLWIIYILLAEKFKTKINTKYFRFKTFILYMVHLL